MIGLLKLKLAIPLLACLLLVPPLTTAASPQGATTSTIEVAGGALLFPDDGIVTEGMVGGAWRYYLTPRLSVGPEVAFVFGHEHSHLMLTGNLTFDILGPVGGQPRAVTPFVVAGGGLYHTRESFPGGDTYTASEGAFTAGGGVRATVGANAVAGAEARLGWETHIRLNAFVGFRF